MRSVAREYGQPELIAALLPISVDGMMAVATVALGDGRRHPFSAWLAFWIGVAASVLANVLAAEPSVIARCISAWRAIAFVLVVEVITRGGRGSVEPATTDSGATGSPIARPKARPGATTHSAVVQPADAGTALQAAPTVSRRKSTKPVRRPISQTRQLAANLRAEFPTMAQAELARRLGISATRLRQVDRAESSPERAQPIYGADVHESAKVDMGR
jgi:hypothetical protein